MNNFRRKKSNTDINKQNLLPLHVIKGAADCDIESMEALLRHFRGYTKMLIALELFDDYNGMNDALGDAVLERAEAELLNSFPKFRKAKLL
ncbi:MAG: helix-turn-helix domain-containing protein [Eubacterium sp.]|jgi:hypothetical protein|nr:helix-turn-helix domain-containing protein [Eubacterium sp.]